MCTRAHSMASPLDEATFDPDYDELVNRQSVADQIALGGILPQNWHQKLAPKISKHTFFPNVLPFNDFK